MHKSRAQQLGHLLGPKTANYWVGASDLGYEGHFVWQSTGRPLKYTNWHSHGPNNWCDETNVCENCVGLWYVGKKRREWNDFICTQKLYFVCEYLRS